MDVESCIASIIQSQEEATSSIKNDQDSAIQTGTKHIENDLKPLDYSQITISEENISMLVEMGYSRIIASDALKFADNSLEQALEMLMNDPEGNFAQKLITNSHTESQV